MNTAVVIIALILGVVGILGAVLPGLPGPPLSWVGMLMMYLWGGTNGAGEHMSLTLLIVWLVITIIVCIIDYFVPAWFTRVTGGSKYAGWGAMIGLFVGLLVPPVGIFVGAIGGAFIAEMLFGNKGILDSATSAIGAFFGFMLGIGFQLIATGFMMYYIIAYI